MQLALLALFLICMLQFHVCLKLINKLNAKLDSHEVYLLQMQEEAQDEKVVLDSLKNQINVLSSPKPAAASAAPTASATAAVSPLLAKQSSTPAKDKLQQADKDSAESAAEGTAQDSAEGAAAHAAPDIEADETTPETDNTAMRVQAEVVLSEDLKGSVKRKTRAPKSSKKTKHEEELLV